MRKLLFVLLIGALSLQAENPSGKWSGNFTITGPDGDTKDDTCWLSLKLDGDAITGTAGPNADKQWSIKEGKLENGELHFQVEADDGLIKFHLRMENGHLRGDASGESPDGKMTAKLDATRVP